MIQNLDLILIVASFVLFALATYPVSSRFNLVAAGLALLTLTLIV